MAALSDQVLPFVFSLFYNNCIKDKYFKLCNYINIVSVCKGLAGSDKNTSCYSLIL